MMAEIDAEELERALVRYETGTTTQWFSDPFNIVLDAARAHLAHLRAPKGELEEARAELGVTKARIASVIRQRHGLPDSRLMDAAILETADLILRAISRPETIFCEFEDCDQEPAQGSALCEGHLADEAEAAALSRARGEGT